MYRVEVLREIPCAPFLVDVSRAELFWLNLAWAQGETFFADASPEDVLLRVSLGIPKGRVLPLTFLCARYCEGDRTANTIHPAKLDLSGRSRE